MDNNRYVFDKRVMKKIFIKYGLILFALFFIFLFINSLFPSETSSTTIILVDFAIGLIIIFIIEVILSKIKSKKEEKTKLREKVNKKEKEEITDVIEVVEVEKRSGRKKDK